MLQEENHRNIINDMVRKRGSIVPIIGEDTVVYRNPDTTEEIPFQEFIVQQFRNKYPRIDVGEAALDSMKERGYYGMSLMMQFYNQQGRFLDDYMEFVRNNTPKIRLKKEVHDFLKAFDFPIIITPICFNIIENDLVGDLEDYKSIWYNLNRENRALPQRCVYHIFGQAKDGSRWVTDEDTLLTFLLSHNNRENEASGLVDYIKERDKKLFVLGCNLPNWLFRFLWQPIQKGLNDIYTQTTQGYWIHKERPDDSFENFLKKKNFSSDAQVRDILVESTKLMQIERQQEADELALMIDKNDSFDVFISYASEDRQIAIRIFNALRNMNVKVWFDNRGMGEITPGQAYWEKIKRGIKDSAHFMPVITENWIQKQFGSSSLKVETQMARDRKEGCATTPGKDNYSIPVIVKGSVYNGVEIGTEYVEKLSEMSLLPKSLFFEINMIEYDGLDFSAFEKIEW